MTEEKQQFLTEKARQVRNLALDGIYAAQSGHPGGSFSAADIITYLYFDKLNVDPQNPTMDSRDRFVLSKGHCCPALYAALAMRGFFDVSEMQSLRKLGALLQGHPDMKTIPGIDMSTGSLGQGISAAVGMALAGKVAKKNYRVYAVLGDGEIAEGQVWEAAMSAAKYHLDNLCAVVDVNGLQIDGATKDVMPSEPLDKKFEAFNWHVIKIDGHDFDALVRAFEEAKTVKGQPTVVLMKTVKGKGVSFMENNAGWHGKAPNDEQYAQAKAELEAKLAELEGK